MNHAITECPVSSHSVCTDPPPRPWAPAAGWLMLLGPGFFLVYGACNAFTARRQDVGTFYFAWEKHIAFIPWMIVPYLSIDLFFAGSFFLCADRPALRTHALRITAAILLSAAGFLLFPLSFGWPRPVVHGWLGALFVPLNTLDLPGNLCPSLHISLRSILWRVYGPAVRAQTWLWTAACAWFALIGASTLFIYQHHVVDLLGGWLVAWLCCALIREKALSDR